MKYYEQVTGIERDELQGGTAIPVEIFNINVGASAIIERGELLCSSALSGIFEPVGGASDANKILCIAAEPFIADSLHAVTSAYFSGEFNREKIRLGGASIEDFEPELRKQNIHLRGLREV